MFWCCPCLFHFHAWDKPTSMTSLLSLRHNSTCFPPSSRMFLLWTHLSLFQAFKNWFQAAVVYKGFTVFLTSFLHEVSRGLLLSSPVPTWPLYIIIIFHITAPKLRAHLIVFYLEIDKQARHMICSSVRWVSSFLPPKNGRGKKLFFCLQLVKFPTPAQQKIQHLILHPRSL